MTENDRKPSRRSIVFCLVLMLLSQVSAQNPAPRPAITNNPELEQIYKEDQAERAGGVKPGLGAAQRDHERLSRVAALLDLKQASMERKRVPLDLGIFDSA